MAFVVPEHNQISPFNILMGTISSQLSRENIRKIKVQLRGHVNKEKLSKLKGGFDVMHILQERGLVSEKKLSFLRKLLQNCELFALIELLDEYKQAVHVMNGKTKEGDNSILTTRRINTLQRLMGRQLEELSNCAARGNDLKQTLEEKQTLLDSQKEIIIIGQEAIDSISEQREVAQQEKSVVEERAQESEAMLKGQEKDFNELKGLLGAKEKNSKKNDKTDRRKSIFDKHTNEKSFKLLETLSKQKEEKQETLKKTVKSVDEIRAQLLAKRETVRHCTEAVLLKTKELVSVDQCILETMEDVKKLKQDIRRNEFDLFDLQQQIEETQDELERTKRNGIANKAFKIPLWRLESPSEKHKTKALNYSEVLEEHSYSLGTLGMRSVPLQFDFPCCVASHNGLIFAADRNNCRVLVFDAVGELSREPIEFGNTGPVAIAVNKKGNIVITDSQIIKVFSSDGALSHNFLPVYSKRDTRPEISALTLDREGNILVADRPNHRIQKFRIDGHFLGFIGGSMYLQYPSGVAITKNNDVVISECESHQLKIFHEHGKSFTVLGRSGVGKDQLMNPRGLAVDNAGNILVADSLNHRIQVIDPEGNFIGSFGRLGSGPGCLDTPYAVAVNRRGHVIVADSGNHRITCFT